MRLQLHNPELILLALLRCCYCYCCWCCWLLLLLFAISCRCCCRCGGCCRYRRCCCSHSPLPLLPLLPPSGPSMLHRHHHGAHVPLHVHRHDVAGAVRVSIASVVAGRVRAAEGVAAAQRVVQSTAAAARLGRIGLGHDVHRRPAQLRLPLQALTEAVVSPAEHLAHGDLVDAPAHPALLHHLRRAERRHEDVVVALGELPRALVVHRATHLLDASLQAADESTQASPAVPPEAAQLLALGGVEEVLEVGWRLLASAGSWLFVLDWGGVGEVMGDEVGEVGEVGEVVVVVGEDGEVEVSLAGLDGGGTPRR